MGDPVDKINSPIVQPVAQIYYEVTGRGGGIFFTMAAYIILNFGAVSAMQSGYRTIWAYSRDGMLPLSSIWYKMDRHTNTPIHAVWLFVTCCLLLNLVALGSYTAIAAVFNLTAITLDWGYCIPIICKLAYGKFERGPFHLGRVSIIINCWAVLWTLFVTIIYVQPTIRPVTTQNVSLSFPSLLSSKLIYQSPDELRLCPHRCSCDLCNSLLVCRRSVLLQWSPSAYPHSLCQRG